MSGLHIWRVSQAGILILLLAASTFIMSSRLHGDAARMSHPSVTSSHIVFAFGREGGNVRPLTVTIDDTGTVRTSYPVGGITGHTHLSTDAVNGLLRLAGAEGFFTMPTHIIGHGLPDIGGRFITIYSHGRTMTVHVRFVRDAAFDQLYAVLGAATGVGS